MRNLLILLSLVGTPAIAEPLAYPGSAWATISSPTTTDKDNPESDNWTLTGRVTQGVDWLTFGEKNDWTLNTYATIGFSLDTKGLDYNNRITPGIGVEITKPVKNGVFNIGIRAIHETRFGTEYKVPDRSSDTIQGYISYWSGWGKK